jgi:hypothetical protein
MRATYPAHLTEFYNKLFRNRGMSMMVIVAFAASDTHAVKYKSSEARKAVDTQCVTFCKTYKS